MTKIHAITIEHCHQCTFWYGGYCRKLVNSPATIYDILYANLPLCPQEGVRTDCPLPDTPKYPIEKLMNDCGFEIYFEGSKIGLRGHGAVYFPGPKPVSPCLACEYDNDDICFGEKLSCDKYMDYIKAGGKQ